jgi:hypothetical protein
MRILVIVGLCLVMDGCGTPDWDHIRAKADVAEQQAAILKLYRTCVERYQEDPAKAKANCEHYAAGPWMRMQ